MSRATVIKNSSEILFQYGPGRTVLVEDSTVAYGVEYGDNLRTPLYSHAIFASWAEYSIHIVLKSISIIFTLVSRYFAGKGLYYVTRVAESSVLLRSLDYVLLCIYAKFESAEMEKIHIIVF